MRIIGGVLAAGVLSLGWIYFPGDAAIEVADLEFGAVEASVSEDGAGLVLTGLPEVLLGEAPLDDRFRVVAAEVEAEHPDELPSTLGEFSADGARLVFTPRYPLVAGLDYRILLADAPGRDDRAHVSWSVQVASTDVTPVATVTSLFPTEDVLPANLLKFYIEFSHAMRPWDPFAYLSLIDEETGATLPNVFLTAHTEMWDPSGTRFTLLFDPGRIKRGLQNNLALGPPLREGRRYSLVVSGEWPDARGVPMRAGFERSFRVGAADRESPDPDQWTLGVPDPASRDALRVEFGEPMDQAYLEHALSIVTPQGTEVSGTGGFDATIGAWTFVPDGLWQAGAYTLEIDARLEDLAGNNLNRLFDMDLDAGESLRNQPIHVVRFTVR